MIHDPEEVARRAVEIAVEGRVRAIDGSLLALTADTICIHGDTPGAPELAHAVRDALGRAGVTLRPMGETIP